MKSQTQGFWEKVLADLKSGDYHLAVRPPHRPGQAGDQARDAGAEAQVQQLPGGTDVGGSMPDQPTIQQGSGQEDHRDLPGPTRHQYQVEGQGTDQGRSQQGFVNRHQERLPMQGRADSEEWEQLAQAQGGHQEADHPLGS